MWSDESDLEGDLQTHAFDLYGLIHARYIITARGLDTMVRLSTVRLCCGIHAAFFFRFTNTERRILANVQWYNAKVVL